MSMLTLVFYPRFVESDSHILLEAELEEQVQQRATRQASPSQAATIPAKSDLLEGIFLGSRLIRLVSRTIRFGLSGGLGVLKIIDSW